MIENLIQKVLKNKLEIIMKNSLATILYDTFPENSSFSQIIFNGILKPENLNSPFRFLLLDLFLLYSQMRFYSDQQIDQILEVLLEN